MPEASVGAVGTSAQPGFGLGWAASLLGLRPCCAGAQAAPGVDETDAESPWSLQSDENALADEVQPRQVKMPPNSKEVENAGSAACHTSSDAKASPSPAKVPAASGDCPTALSGDSKGAPAAKAKPATSKEGAPAGAKSSKTPSTPADDAARAKKPAAVAKAADAEMSKSREGARSSTIEDRAEQKADKPEQKKFGQASLEKRLKKESEEREKKKPEKPKVSYLAKLKEERRLQDERQKEMSKVVDDMFAGKYNQPDGKGQPGGAMLIRMPSPYERKNTKAMMLEKYRVEYKKIKKQGAETPCTTSVATNQYTSKEAQGLSIQGGHQYIPRPAGIKLPKNFRKSVGVLPLKKLNDFDSENDRMLISVYGDIFDVSDRPDKYGPDGPYSWMAGHDLTWGFVSGRDVPETIDFMYDLWKIAPDDFREKKLGCTLAWVAWYEYEYGKAVGRVEEYNKEPSLKGPPMEDAAEDCCIM